MVPVIYKGGMLAEAQQGNPCIHRGGDIVIDFTTTVSTVVGVGVKIALYLRKNHSLHSSS